MIDDGIAPLYRQAPQHIETRCNYLERMYNAPYAEGHVTGVPARNEALPGLLLSASPARDVRIGVARRQVFRCELEACWAESSRCDRAVAEAAMMGVRHGSR